MLLTEKEARTKWCPMTRTGAYTDKGITTAIAVNRDPREEVQEGCACLASDCAMWRWHGNVRRRFTICEDRRAAVEPKNRPMSVPPDWLFAPYAEDEGDYARWIEPEQSADQRRVGYCGLAGAPTTA